eukprot:1256369-Amphidinium_carterae.1
MAGRVESTIAEVGNVGSGQMSPPPRPLLGLMEVTLGSAAGLSYSAGVSNANGMEFRCKGKIQLPRFEVSRESGPRTYMTQQCFLTAY